MNQKTQIKGGRYSSVDPSALTILWTQVWSQSPKSMLYYLHTLLKLIDICYWVLKRIK